MFFDIFQVHLRSEILIKPQTPVGNRKSNLIDTITVPCRPWMSRSNRKTLWDKSYLDRRFLLGVIDLPKSTIAALYSSRSSDAFARWLAGSQLFSYEG